MAFDVCTKSFMPEIQIEIKVCHTHWTDPAMPPWTPPLSFLDREIAVIHIRQARDFALAGDL